MKAKAEITSDSLSLLKTIYDALPTKDVDIELFADDAKAITNPTWKDVKNYHNLYGTITLKYEKP